MKKIILPLIIATLSFGAAVAQTDSSRSTTGYRYYPEANVYFNPGSNQYSWYDSGTSTWTTGATLPSSVKITNRNKYNSIQYKGSDVWSANADHRKMYTPNNNNTGNDSNGNRRNNGNGNNNPTGNGTNNNNGTNSNSTNSSSTPTNGTNSGNNTNGTSSGNGTSGTNSGNGTSGTTNGSNSTNGTNGTNKPATTVPPRK
jgi:hypothetical protein